MEQHLNTELSYQLIETLSSWHNAGNYKQNFSKNKPFAPACFQKKSIITPQQFPMNWNQTNISSGSFSSDQYIAFQGVLNFSFQNSLEEFFLYVATNHIRFFHKCTMKFQQHKVCSAMLTSTCLCRILKSFRLGSNVGKAL